ncbi:rod shape-determining protein MreC [Nonlabens ponticola]|uniref:Cell shape-determining protein MreC n=1 Tax=Nonlabens ponticola TaxID=2496866 RepID=A0A3S9MWT7_9FLAO|nr:rod shape-determining protein MreC [Nonlabens ponticola]AZQ43602.1 rod shape-determining protein MreC [Nonlabens ponticola]
MQHIINFLIKYRNLLLYLFLLTVATVFTIQSHNYHRTTFIHSTGNVTGSILETRTGIYDYFDLGVENEKLALENARLRMKLLATGDTLLGEDTNFIFADSIPYTITPARVINNGYADLDNFITLDIGSEQEINSDMGVISSNGIVGVVDVVNSDYARVISVLNSDISLNAQIKGTNTIGSLIWDGKDPYYMNLIDVPRLAAVSKGDTIITGQYSTTFPPDIEIGVVEDAVLVENGSRYQVSVRLFNDMTDLGYVYVIKNRDREIIQSLDTLTVNE